MRKNYFMVLIALLSLSLTALAQENKWETLTAPEAPEAQGDTYNMVITLPDGTTFTIGTDDVDEVTFSNGQVSVTGTSVQKLLEYCLDIQKQQAMLEKDMYGEILQLQNDLCPAVAVLQTALANLTNDVILHGTSITELLSRTANLEPHVDTNTTDIDWLKYFYVTLSNKVDGIEGKVSDLDGKVANLGGSEEQQSRISMLEVALAILEAKAADQQDQNQRLQDQIDYMHNYIDDLILEMLDLKKRIDDIESKQQ